MSKRLTDSRAEQPLLDIASYGRLRSSESRALTPSEIAYIRRTVSRVPEVMLKVSGGARSLAGVRAHFDYIGREGRGIVEADDGAWIQERGFESALVESWDLDLDVVARRIQRTVSVRQRPPKLVHNLVFSMPKGTPPEKLQCAVRAFVREKFADRHRYVMALRADQGHPHVHVVVRAMSEQGERLNIRKAMLRAWRKDFAACLRNLGVQANATQVAGAVANGAAPQSFRSDRLIGARNDVARGWGVVAQMLDSQGEGEIATLVRRFLQQMPAGQTENGQWVESLKAAPQREPTPPERGPI